MNTPPRILLTGASGLLGGNILESFPDDWPILAFSQRTNIQPQKASRVCRQVDIHQWKTVAAIENAVGDFQPTVIIHCAALTNVDQCEIDREKAYMLHVESTRILCSYAARNRLHVIQISTDHLFSGGKGKSTEQDLPQPLNYYAETKWLGEQVVRKSGAPHTIVRTNFFGFNLQDKQDFAWWIVTRLKNHEPITLFHDIIFSPIYVGTLVHYVERIILAGVQGTLHIAARDACSKYDFGMRLAKLFGFDAQNIVSTPSHFIVPRPKNMSLDVSLAEQLFGELLPTIDENIAAYVSAFDAGLASRLRLWVK